MEKYRAFVHYYFKKGKEELGLKFLEKELINHAQQFGCHAIFLWQDEKDHSHVIGTGDWGSLEEAKKFQDHWGKKEKELLHLCSNEPHHEFCSIRANYEKSKAKKAA